MSNDWLGTFNRSQFDRFVSFAKDQALDAQARMAHLNAERQRVGIVNFTYDQGGRPVQYVADPKDSYLGRLLAVYEVLGGDAFYDLNVRSMSQPVYVIRGDEANPAQIMSNGEVIGSSGQADAPTALLMQQARAWMTDAIDYKRDYLERKIRRMLDYSDQLAAEIQVLSLITQTVDTNGSLDNLFSEIQALFGDPSYRAIYNDNGKDPDGKEVGGPFLPYENGPSRPAGEAYGRGESGAAKPGVNS